MLVNKPEFLVSPVVPRSIFDGIKGRYSPMIAEDTAPNTLPTVDSIFGKYGVSAETLDTIRKGNALAQSMAPLSVSLVGNDSVRYNPLQRAYHTHLAPYGESLKNSPAVKGLNASWRHMSLGDKANTVLGGIGMVMNGINAYRAGKLANKQFEHQKQMAERNYQNQRQQTNRQLEDRQRMRVRNDPRAMSVGEYMAKHGVR